jgi:hypothetical protein
LHVVCGKDVRDARKLVEQAVFEAEQRRWANDSGLGEDATCYSLSSSLELFLALLNIYS